MEIEVGNYVRTPIGIFIISHINIDFDDNDKNKCLLCQNEKVLFLSIETIKSLKHSKIISEIVEVGDYVNGKLIHKIDKGTNYCYLYYGNCKTFVNYQIKSIVTHEQFSSIEYKVEEDK